MADESVTEQLKDLKIDEKKVSYVHAVSCLANELKKSSETVIACCCQNPLCLILYSF